MFLLNNCNDTLPKTPLSKTCLTRPNIYNTYPVSDIVLNFKECVSSLFFSKFFSSSRSPSDIVCLHTKHE